MEKAMAKALERVMKAIMRVIAMILRMLGLGGGGASGAGVMPNAPKAGNQDEIIETASPSKGLGLSPEQKASMSSAIAAFALADRETRKSIDLTALPVIERAFLAACDEQTLTRIAKMDTDQALDFVLEQTASARQQIVKPMRKTKASPKEDDREVGYAGLVMDAGLRMAA
jgi:hypothetical protein